MTQQYKYIFFYLMMKFKRFSFKNFKDLIHFSNSILFNELNQFLNGLYFHPILILIKFFYYSIFQYVFEIEIIGTNLKTNKSKFYRE